MRLLGFTSILLLCISLNAHAMGRKKPQYLMGAMGDSISAGTLADTSTWVPENTPPPAGNSTFDPAQSSQIIYTNKSTYSWTSGKMIQSHFNRLSQYLQKSGDSGGLKMFNVAVPGNETRHLPGQADQLIAEMQRGGYKALKYVTFLIGANDACTGTPVERMRDELRVAFRKLASIPQDEPIRIIVSAMPRIPELGDESIRRHPTMGVLTCEYMRSHVLKECNPLTHWQTQTEFQAALDEVTSRNQVIQDTALEAASQYRNLDIHFSDALFSNHIPMEMLAIDCFHPNRDGQQYISDLLWDAQPWFK